MFQSRRSLLAGLATGGALIVMTGRRSAAVTAATNPNADRLPAEQVQQFVGASHGNVEKVKSMLEETPALVNATHDWGAGDFENGLNAASHTGNREIALMLLDQGARLDCCAAAMLGMENVLREMLSLCPVLHATPGAHNISLLIHAAFGREPAAGTFELLLNAGADVNAASKIGMTPLMAVCRTGNVEQARGLLQRGADVAAVDNQSRTALQLAEEGGHPELVTLLRNHKD